MCFFGIFRGGCGISHRGGGTTRWGGGFFTAPRDKLSGIFRLEREISHFQPIRSEFPVFDLKDPGYVPYHDQSQKRDRPKIVVVCVVGYFRK